jgi:hypothetical protein
MDAQERLRDQDVRKPWFAVKRLHADDVARMPPE